MGWSGGSELGERVAKAIKKHVPDKKARTAIYTELVKALEAGDCDTLHEMQDVDPVLKAVLKKMGHLDDAFEEEE